MKSRIEALLQEIATIEIPTSDALEQFRIQYLGKKGILAALFVDFKEVPGPEKKETGLLLNQLKQAAEQKIESLREVLEAQQAQQVEIPDLSRPAGGHEAGSRHPVSLVMNQMIGIFQRLGFNLSDGPEIVDDWHNFGALNFDEDHPARDMQDTFFLSNPEGWLLRTHTSSVQVQEMMKGQLPLRAIMPGRVYRNETISARAHCQFHQIEGLYIAEDASFADLKQTLYSFVREMFGPDSKVRFRPSYFPFTEISAEMDVSCFICGGEGCAVCKQTGWVEILGCGMVDPQVLINCGIDPEKYQGYAFGIGVERMAMLKYGIRDLRLFFENDARFLKQFHLGLGL